MLAVAVVVGTALTGATALPGDADASAKASKVHYTKNTVVVSKKTLKSELEHVSKSGSIYTFKSKRGSLAKLEKGKVMLLTDYAVRDVTHVKTSHGHFLVYTKPAALTDFIASGTLSWDTSVPFKDGFGVGGSAVPAGAVRASDALPAKFGMTPMGSGPSISYKGKVDTWEYKITFKPGKKNVSVEISISKESPVEVEAKITGTITNLETKGKFAVKDGRLVTASAITKSLHGDFELAYTAKPVSQLGLGRSGGIKITLPGEIAIPFLVGPVPFFLGIKVAFFASAGFSSVNDPEISGSYKFSYDGSSGFTTSKSGATDPQGVVKAIADIIENVKNAVKYGPMSFIFGATMPQLELGLGVKGLNVAGHVALIGTTGIATQGAGCDTRAMEIVGKAGATASFFGFSAETGDATLFDKTYNSSSPQGCGTFPSVAQARTALSH